MRDYGGVWGARWGKCRNVSYGGQGLIARLVNAFSCGGWFLMRRRAFGCDRCCVGAVVDLKTRVEVRRVRRGLHGEGAKGRAVREQRKG